MKNMNRKPIIGITPDLAQNCEKYTMLPFLGMHYVRIIPMQ